MPVLLFYSHTLQLALGETALYSRTCCSQPTFPKHGAGQVWDAVLGTGCPKSWCANGLAFLSPALSSPKLVSSKEQLPLVPALGRSDFVLVIVLLRYTRMSGVYVSFRLSSQWKEQTWQRGCIHLHGGNFVEEEVPGQSPVSLESTARLGWCY